jgi:hypothetical protein
MFMKGTIAAGILAATLAFMPEAASAKTVVKVGVGGGSHPCLNRSHGRCNWGHNWHHGWRYRIYNPHIVYSYGGYNNGYYDRSRVGCGEAKAILHDHGFVKVRAINCGGKYHAFKARRGGHGFALKVSSWTGRVIVSARY